MKKNMQGKKVEYRPTEEGTDSQGQSLLKTLL